MLPLYALKLNLQTDGLNDTNLHSVGGSALSKVSKPARWSWMVIRDMRNTVCNESFHILWHLLQMNQILIRCTFIWPCKKVMMKNSSRQCLTRSILTLTIGSGMSSINQKFFTVFLGNWLGIPPEVHECNNSNHHQSSDCLPIWVSVLACFFESIHHRRQGALDAGMTSTNGNGKQIKEDLFFWHEPRLLLLRYSTIVSFPHHVDHGFSRCSY